MNTSFMEAVESNPLVFDGGMGTRLYERGVYVNKSFDHTNLKNPDLVRSIHEEYIEAGAEVVTTNTFSSNYLKLKSHGLEEKSDEIVRAGARLAVEAAEDRAFVAGSVGPTGKTPTMLTAEELDEIRNVFRRQIEILVEEGVDVLIFETFRQMSEIEIALEAAHEVCDLPIIAQMAFDSDRVTADGADPERVAVLLGEWGADVVGANCMEGPHIIYDVVNEMLDVGVPVIAEPNAGYPKEVNERLVYMATPEYFGVYARRFFESGVRMVGGCCGTGPEHIERIANAAKMFGGGQVAQKTPDIEVDGPLESEIPDRDPPEAPTELAQKIERVYDERVKQGEPATGTDDFVVSVEVNPPTSLYPQSGIDAARMLTEGGADVINIADGPRASVRMANWAMGQIVQQNLDIEVILHICGRDRNLLGLQSDILGLEALGLNNLVIITGDPPKVGDYPDATAVFDLDSIGILRMVQNLNVGIDPAGKDIGDRTSFYCATGAEPAAKDYERELRRLEKKKEAGARFVMTQPVYDPEVLQTFLDDIEHLDMPVLVGLLPLASYRNAEFLHNEVPGMAVPDDIRKRMKEVGSGPEAKQEGVEIAQEMLKGVHDQVVGAYIMPPFRRYVAALEILEFLDGYTVPEDST